MSLPTPTLDDGASELDAAQAAAGRIAGFREDTRDQRISVAREAEHRFERKVAWAVSIGDQTEVFSHLAVPVMTRLRQPDRQVLDTLVAANIARSRAEAVAWCVRLDSMPTNGWVNCAMQWSMSNVSETRVQTSANAGKRFQKRFGKRCSSHQAVAVSSMARLTARGFSIIIM